MGGKPCIRGMRVTVGTVVGLVASGHSSARILEDLRAEGMSFFELALDSARRHKKYFRLLTPLSAEVETLMQQEVRESLVRQSEIESSDEISFDEYLHAWFEAD